MDAISTCFTKKRHTISLELTHTNYSSIHISTYQMETTHARFILLQISKSYTTYLDNIVQPDVVGVPWLLSWQENAIQNLTIKVQQVAEI